MEINLDDKATQTGFAALVGVSQPAINARINAGALQSGGTYRQWLIEYCEKLRVEAGGRGGDEASTLARARTKESLIKTRKLELEYYKEVGLVVPVEVLEPVLSEWASFAQSEVTNCVARLVVGIESQHKIEIDQEAVDNGIRPALSNIAGYAAHLEKVIGARGDELAAPAEGADTALAEG